MLHGDAIYSSSRRHVRQYLSTERRALLEAVILGLIGLAAWVFIARTEICTRFFQYVSAHPEKELDSAILAGMILAIGVLVFALRRWNEASRARRICSSLAFHDPLTGLPNRRAFMAALEDASRRDNPACIMLDLDKFSKVNDLSGHLVGDQLLQQISNRLTATLSPDVLVARLGGDEFGLICQSCDSENALDVANLVVGLVTEPLPVEGREVQVGVSVGIGTYLDDSDEPSSLLRSADIALYRAKRSGGGSIQIFAPEMEQSDRRYAAVAEALRVAISKGEIVPHYQPLVELSTDNVVGFEVLSRWESPGLGSVGPNEFIPVAIDSGLIGKLSWHVLDQACSDAAHWPIPMRISFNLAPLQLCDPLLPIQMLSTLSKTHFPPQRLDIEMTEEARIANDEMAKANLEALRGAGITSALDDFGSGYSSLHHLRSLPFDRVKVDRTYVSQITNCGKSRRMVEAIITFIHSLGMPVVAEGVETAEQAALLVELGCDFAQGWLYGKAVANSEIEARFLTSSRASRLQWRV